MADLAGWRKIGFDVVYLYADHREGPVVHEGRGVLTFWQNSSDGIKESWRPPTDDFRLVWNDEMHQWDLYVPVDAPLLPWERDETPEFGG